MTLENSYFYFRQIKDVMLRRIPIEGGEPEVMVELFGGQGTINVPSWSPDPKRVAFVRYEL